MAAVAFELDGRPIGRVSQPPWTAEVDFGRDLVPHELAARAFDAEEREIARARQWLNLPRPPAEAKILLERDAGGRARGAHISWQSLTGEAPAKIEVSFDGRALPLRADRRVEIPVYAPETSHILTVELEFGNGMASRDDLAIGGGTGAEAQTELTGVPVRLANKATLPPIDVLEELFRGPSGPLRVAAAEEGGAHIWIVRDDNASETQSSLNGGRVPRRMRGLVPDLLLEKGDAVRFLWPRARGFPGAAVPAALFPSSSEFSASRGKSLTFLLGAISNPEPSGLFPMYADAVAVAGLNAYSSFGRRAVVLVLPGSSPDASHYSPGIVRRYLESIRVPLFVWSLEPVPPSRSPWGLVEAVGTAGGLRAAGDRLRESLERQRIVWVEGRYLPQQVSLSEAAPGLALLR